MKDVKSILWGRVLEGFWLWAPSLRLVEENMLIKAGEYIKCQGYDAKHRGFSRFTFM